MTEQKTKKKKSMKFIALDQTKQKALALKAKKHKVRACCFLTIFHHIHCWMLNTLLQAL